MALEVVVLIYNPCSGVVNTDAIRGQSSRYPVDSGVIFGSDKCSPHWTIFALLVEANGGSDQFLPNLGGAVAWNTRHKSFKSPEQAHSGQSVRSSHVFIPRLLLLL